MTGESIEVELKSYGLPTVSFINSSDKNTFQIELILRLIMKSINNKKPITVFDIQDIYTDYCIKAKRHRTNYANRFINGKWECYAFQTREDWQEYYCTTTRAVVWFKSNLGAAILKGKLIVIPIIEI